MYDGCRVGFYECVCAEVSSCVGLYKDVDVYDGHEAVFFCMFRSVVVSHSLNYKELY